MTSGKITELTIPAMPEASSFSVLSRKGSRGFLMLFWTEYPCKTGVTWVSSPERQKVKNSIPEPKNSNWKLLQLMNFQQGSWIQN